MKHINIREFVLVLDWLSIFALLWLMILDIVPTDVVWSWGFLGIFLFIALGASASGNERINNGQTSR